MLNASTDQSNINFPFAKRLLISLIYTLLSLGIGYVLFVLYYRYDHNIPFRHFLLSPIGFRPVIFLATGFPIFVMILVRFSSIRGLPSIILKYLGVFLTIGYVILTYVGAMLSSDAAAGYGVVAIFYFSIFAVPFFAIVGFLWGQLWPFKPSRFKLTLFLLSFFLLTGVVLMAELLISNRGSQKQISNATLVPVGISIILKEEYELVAVANKLMDVSRGDKSYVGQSDYPIAWIDKDNLLYGKSSVSGSEFWIRDVNLQKSYRVLPEVIITNASRPDNFIISPDKKWLGVVVDWDEYFSQSNCKESDGVETCSNNGGGIFLVKADGSSIVHLDSYICGTGGDKMQVYYGRSCKDLKWGSDGIYIHFVSAGEPELFVKVNFEMPN